MFTKLLNKLFQANLGDGDENLLHIQSEILQQLRLKLRQLPDERAYFPATLLIVQLYAESEEQRLDYEKYFCEKRMLEKKLREELRRQKAEQDAEQLPISVEVVCEKGGDWTTPRFNLLAFRKKNAAPFASLAIRRGQTERADYELSSRTCIGRTKEPFDSQLGVSRRNDVVFEDLRDGINETVSRLHARIELDVVSGEYQLYDDNSQMGTRIERDGELIAVKGPRGTLLQDGDLIHFGKAIALFTQSFREDPTALTAPH